MVCLKYRGYFILTHWTRASNRPAATHPLAKCVMKSIPFISHETPLKECTLKATEAADMTVRVSARTH